MPETIHIRLPDGSEKELPKGSTALDVAKSISPRLAEAAIAAKARPLSGNGSKPDQNRADLEGRPYTGETPVSPQADSDQAGEGARPTQDRAGLETRSHTSNGDLIDLTRPLEKD